MAGGGRRVGHPFADPRPACAECRQRTHAAGDGRPLELPLDQAALAMGVVEWSSQAVAGAFKLHGGTWLVGGTLQALSAAYLTRVVGHAMADLMARSVGVSEPDLEAIKAEAPLLVARAAEAERLDWAAFLQEARDWLMQQVQAQPLQNEGA
jgi:hypothetical protein